jgi:hypothetical protein
VIFASICACTHGVFLQYLSLLGSAFSVCLYPSRAYCRLRSPFALLHSMPAARAQHVAADSAAANADATAEVAAKPKAAAPAASPKPEAKKEDMVPAMVLAKEKALQVQIAQLQSDLNKEKST